MEIYLMVINFFQPNENANEKVPDEFDLQIN